jgi:chromosome segregation ATPase
MDPKQVLWKAAVALGIALVANVRSYAAGDPGAVLAAKGLHAVGSVYVTKGEDEVLKAVRSVEAKLRDYRRETDANRTDAEKRALAAELSAQRNVLQRQVNQALPGIQAQIRALTMQQAALSAQNATGGRLGDMARGSLPPTNTQTVYQLGVLGQQIAQLQMQGAEMTAALNELNKQITELTPRNATVQPKSKTDGKPPASAVDEKRKALKAAITEARKIVDETTKAYATLAEDSQVKSAFDDLKRTLSSKPTLGPSKNMLAAVKALDRAEAYATNPDDPSIAPRSTPVSKRKSRFAKQK